ncbi:MAG: hypothetical protein LBI84_05810 [Propionibacteriaceae bacterium]|jgi:hypothetical protein|nr:hypothetical protein [Propionibacteriaceae bacterium]
MLDLVKAEALKITTARSAWIIVALLILGMAVLGFSTGVGIKQVGLSATPETTPTLAEPIGPIEYIGSEPLFTGTALMAVLGGLTGASEFRHHQLRTTFLGANHRTQAFLAKLVCLAIFLAVCSFLGAWTAFTTVQLGLGGLGLDPVSLSDVSWRLIGKAALAWTLMGLIGQGVSILCRSALIPILVFIPLSFGLSDLLAKAWKLAEYLPTAAAGALTASPVHPAPYGEARGVGVLTIWLLVTVGGALIAFTRRDVGAR